MTYRRTSHCYSQHYGYVAEMMACSVSIRILGKKLREKKRVSLTLGSKLLHSLDFSYVMLRSITEDVLQHG